LEIIDFIILGLVQGLTEFLPVSSSGHLILAQHLLGMNPPGVAAEVMLHLATLLSVLVVYGRDFLKLLRSRNWPYIGALALATVITVALALPFKDRMESFADSSAAVKYVGAFLLLTAILLLLAEQRARHLAGKAVASELQSPGWGRAALTGVVQAIAVIPGISRSGSTISAMLICGIGYESAARFSFMLSVPVILGAAVLSIPDLQAGTANGSLHVVPLLAGFAAAAVSGVLAIRFLLAILRRQRLFMFSIYCAVVGILALLFG
jgi:undecaprenyl-diphosphatase